MELIDLKYKKISFEETNRFSKNGVDFIGYSPIDNNMSFVIETVKEGHFEEFVHDKCTFTYIFLEGKGTFYLENDLEKRVLRCVLLVILLLPKMQNPEE